jgi:hypothetical protein
MKTLQDVAKSFKKAAGKAIYPGVPYSGYKKTGSSKAFKTGKLLSKFVTSPQNAPNQIGKKDPNGLGFTLILEVGPKDAEYGTYVHYGTYKMDNRPFAQLATNDSDFQNVLNEFLGEQIDEMITERMGEMDAGWKAAGFTIS